MYAGISGKTESSEDIMTNNSENLLVTADDGFNGTAANERMIQGTIVKCVDGHWTDRDGLPLQPGTQLLVLASTSIVQCWQDQRPIDTIIKQPGQPLPDVDELNAQIPEDEWEDGIDGKPRPPWQHQEVVYLLDQATAEKYTFASGTTGARIAVDNLRDRIKWMRALRGQSVVPVVELANKPMKTRFGQKLRPEFKVMSWVELGVGLTRDVTPQIEHAEQSKTAPQLEDKKGNGGIKPVNPVTIEEEITEAIPF
jgi:hypothetical protein